MTRAEEMTMLSNKLNSLSPCSKEWDKAYSRYFELSALEQEEYKSENIGKLEAFYHKHIEGKDFAEIDGDAWDFYSDFYKDVFGHRPRTTRIFGE